MLNEHFGSSIVELTSVVAIVAVLVSSAVPAVEGYYDKKRLVAAAEMVYSQLQKARSEAIARSEDVYVQFNSDGGENWAVGLSTSLGCNPDHLLDDTNPCFLTVDDGDEVAGDGDRVLQTENSKDYPGIRMAGVTFNSDSAKFDYVRGTGKAGSVKLESASGYRLKVVTSLIGRVRMCSPSGNTNVAGYPTKSCSW
jgi:type II secretory pathway pseudopilin PulG